MVGRLRTQVRRVRAHARETQWYRPKLVYSRDWLRPRILNSPPIPDTTDQTAEIHVLTSANDWLNLIWSLKSFYAQVPQKYALTVHGDPELPAEAVAQLRRHFPQARVIEQKDIRDQVLDSLTAYPRCKAFRETNTLSIKVFDFAHALQTNRMILFDSDLLFFAKPEAFLRYLAPDSQVNVFNRDVATAYAVEMDVIEAHGVSVLPEVNSGFGVVHKDSMRLDWIEEFLGIPGLPEGHFWRIEQTLYALCGTRFGAELLPDDYRVFLTGEVGAKPYRHYVGAVRKQMYTEGMYALRRPLLAG